MENYREIISKAIISKGKKKIQEKDSIKVDHLPSTVLGCWVINHKFNGVKQKDKIVIDGSFDVNIWYSYDDDTKTAVVKSSHNYNEIVKMKDIKDDYDNVNIILRSITDPKCIKADINEDIIDYQVDLELGIELVGDVKVKVKVDENLDDYEQIVEENTIDKEIDENINLDYLKKE